MEDSWNERVWALVASIPAGKVVSYSGVAAILGFPRRARHVSRALNQAPEGMNLPWQRVINAQGKISFPPQTAHFHLQRILLEEEGVRFKANGSVDLQLFGWRPGEN